MSQIVSRINIQVKKKTFWKKLMEIDVSKYGINMTAGELFGECNKQFILTDWSCPEKKLLAFVKAINKSIEAVDDVVIIADTTDMSENSSIYGIYYCGDKVKDFYFSCDSDKANMFHETDINQIQEWINYAELPLNKRELELLKSFKIVLSYKPQSKAKQLKKDKYDSVVYVKFNSSQIAYEVLNEWKLLDREGIEKNLCELLENKKYGVYSLINQDTTIEVHAYDCSAKDVVDFMKSLGEKTKNKGDLYGASWNITSERLTLLGKKGEKFKEVERNISDYCDPKTARQEGWIVQEIIGLDDLVEALER